MRANATAAVVLAAPLVSNVGSAAETFNEVRSRHGSANDFFARRQLEKNDIAVQPKTRRTFNIDNCGRRCALTR